eukprot:12339221-Prorocentrum_lima.AAC.1
MDAASQHTVGGADDKRKGEAAPTRVWADMEDSCSEEAHAGVDGPAPAVPCSSCHPVIPGHCNVPFPCPSRYVDFDAPPEAKDPDKGE